MSLKTIFAEARLNGNYVHLVNYYTDIPSWQDCIGNLNYQFHESAATGRTFPPSEMLYLDNNRSPSILCRENLNIYSFHAIQYISKNTYDHGGFFPQVDAIINEIHDSFDDLKIFAGKLHLNLVANNREYEVHEDDHDVISWNLSGTVEYRIYHDKNDESKYDSVILCPGDIIYVPKHLTHSVVVSEPRSTIIFQLHTENDPNVIW